MRKHPLLSLLIVDLALWAGTVWMLVVPLFRPAEARGEYLGGCYELIQLYVGVPLLVVALAATTVLVAPQRLRLKLGLRLGVAVFATLFAVGLFDVVWALVVVGARTPNYWLDQGHVSRLDNEPDPELGFVRKPRTSWYGRLPGSTEVVHYETDDQGFRNDADIQRADVVFIGDSYTEAAQRPRELTFVARVGEETGLSVVNLGRGAYGPQQELIVLRRYGLARSPRFVVWQLFEGNDLSDARNFALWKDDPNRLILGLRDRYLANSFFHPWLAGTRRGPHGDFASLRCADGSLQRLGVRYRFQPDLVAERPRGFEETRRAISEGVELCEANGIELVVLLIPVMARVDAPWLEFDDPADRARYAPPNPEPRRDFAAQLAAHCKAIDCALIDAFPAFRRAAEQDPKGIYIPTDEHLDVRGHGLVTALVVDWIRSRK